MRNGFNNFLSDLKETCLKNRVTINLHNGKFIEHEGKNYGGWFDDEKRELHCAYPDNASNKYKEVLIHESCHLDQWLLQTKAWRDYNTNDSGGKVWKWFDGKPIKDLNKHIRIIQRMEAECEQMAVDKIKKYGINIDVQRYVRRCNSYLMAYSVMKETRKWTDYQPYKFKAIYEQMPSYAVISNLPLTPEIKDTFNRLCYKK